MPIIPPLKPGDPSLKYGGVSGGIGTEVLSVAIFRLVARAFESARLV